MKSINLKPLVGDISGMDITYYVVEGFINSTIGLSDLNSTNCLNIINLYYTNFTSTFINEFKAGQYSQWERDTTGDPRSVNNLVDSCLWMLDHLDENYGSYSNTFVFLN